MSAWRQVAAKELRAESRSRDTLVPILLVGLLVVLVGALAFHDVVGASVAADAHLASGVVWIGLAFASATGAARAFGAERDRGTLDTLLTLPAERGDVYVGKAVAHFALVLVAALVLVPVWIVASGAPFATRDAPALLLVLALGAFGLAATGTLLGALAAQTRARDAMLPVLMLPLAIPLLISSTHATAAILAAEPFGSWRGELLVLLGYDVAFAAASWLLADAALGGGGA